MLRRSSSSVSPSVWMLKPRALAEYPPSTPSSLTSKMISVPDVACPALAGPRYPDFAGTGAQSNYSMPHYASMGLPRVERRGRRQAAATMGRMTAGTFDTLAAARDLESAGTDRPQAEAAAAAIRAGQGELAAKADLAHLATKADLAAAEGRQTRQLLLTLAVHAGLIITVLKLFP